MTLQKFDHAAEANEYLAQARAAAKVHSKPERVSAYAAIAQAHATMALVKLQQEAMQPTTIHYGDVVCAGATFETRISDTSERRPLL